MRDAEVCTKADKRLYYANIGLVTHCKMHSHNAEWKLHTAEYILLTSEYKLHTAEYTLQASEYKLHTAEYILQTSEHKLHTADCTPQSSNYTINATHHKLQD